MQHYIPNANPKSKLIVDVLIINHLHMLDWMTSHITYVLPTTETYQ